MLSVVCLAVKPPVACCAWPLPAGTRRGHPRRTSRPLEVAYTSTFRPNTISKKRAHARVNLRGNSSEEQRRVGYSHRAQSGSMASLEYKVVVNGQGAYAVKGIHQGIVPLRGIRRWERSTFTSAM